MLEIDFLVTLKGSNMTFTRSLRTFCALSMVALLSNIPHVAIAEAAKGQMISTAVVVEELTRAEAQANVDTFLNRDDVRQQLVAKGLSENEVKLRIASLSETELKQLSKQMDEARAGGDILIAILVVVLIIFLIKRI